MNKIPVIETVAESYRFIFGGLGKVIGLIWLPILILTVGSYFTLIPYFSGTAEALEAGDVSQQGLLFARVLGFDLVMVVLLSMIAVAITREILTPHKSVSYVHFSLGMTELRVVAAYFGLIMLMMVFVFALVMIGMIALFGAKAALPGAAGQLQAMAFAGLAYLVGFVVLIYFLVRLSFLMVPAVVAEGNYGIEQSWKLTKGNFWRIVAIGLGTLVPVMIVCIGAEIAIVGVDFLKPPPIDALKDAAGMARMQAAQMRQLSAHMPMLVGLGFLVAPLTYGLSFAPAAFAYRALKAKTAQQLPGAR